MTAVRIFMSFLSEWVGRASLSLATSGYNVTA
jgi:hypothetical protein